MIIGIIFIVVIIIQVNHRHDHAWSSRCKVTFYCSETCSHADWTNHRSACSKVQYILLQGFAQFCRNFIWKLPHRQHDRLSICWYFGWVWQISETNPKNKLMMRRPGLSSRRIHPKSEQIGGDLLLTMSTSPYPLGLNFFGNICQHLDWDSYPQTPFFMISVIDIWISVMIISMYPVLKQRNVLKHPFSGKLCAKKCPQSAILFQEKQRRCRKTSGSQEVDWIKREIQWF